ncbi:hypothetical protein HPB47_007676, partial [Ixodes persulcatus]
MSVSDVIVAILQGTPASTVRDGNEKDLVPQLTRPTTCSFSVMKCQMLGLLMLSGDIHCNPGPFPVQCYNARISDRINSHGERYMIILLTGDFNLHINWNSSDPMPTGETEAKLLECMLYVNLTQTVMTTPLNTILRWFLLKMSPVLQRAAAVRKMSHGLVLLLRRRDSLCGKHVRVVNDLNITDEEKNQDRLWRVRPLIAEVLKGCHKLPREELVSVDEQMIPFSGRTQLRQFLPRKPNPEGLKNFVLASPSGLILDFEIYQGKKSLLCPGSSGIAESAVLRLAQTLSPGTRLFFDRYFTSPALLDKLVKKDIAGTGTVMNNPLPKGVKLSSEGQLKARGRGTSEMWVRSDDQQII